VLTSELDGLPDLTLVEFQFSDNQSQVDVETTLYASSEVAPELAQSLADELELALERPVSMHIVSIPVVEVTVPLR
jgi:hypothetical protein